MININGLNAASRDKKLAGLENVNVQNKAKSMQDMMSAEIMVTISKEAKKKQEEQRKQTELAKNDEPKRYKSVFDEDDEDDIDDMVRALSDGEDGEVVIKESSGENTQVRE